MTITAAADGSALGNPGPAGWAWYIDEDTWRAGGWPHGTNNMGELKAVLDLLESTAARADEPLRVLCDSQYVINSVTRWMPAWKKRGWTKKDGRPVLNVELMRALDTALAGRDVRFEWVKGHAGHELNEAADARARAVATAFQAGAPAPEGPGFDGARAAATAARTDAPAPGDLGSGGAGAGTSVPRTGAPVTEGPDRGGARAAAPVSAAPAVGGAEADDVVGGVQADDGEAGDPDLLAELAAHEDDLARGTAPERAVAALERELLREDVRADPDRVSRLLHEDFAEVGASGRWWSREDLLERLPREEALGPVDVQVLSCASLGPAAVHLLYRLTTGEGTSLRSSLWVREDSRTELGAWQLRFHQGTREA